VTDHGEAELGGESEHARLGPDVAGYVLGGLSADEQQAFEAHLATCPTCRVELADLDPLPVLLDLARSDPVSDPGRVSTALPEPSPAVPAAPSAGAAPSTKRRRRTLVGAAAVVLALLVGGAVGVAATRTDGPRFSPPVMLEAVGNAASTSPTPAGTASWRTIDSGTLVRLDLTGMTGDGTYYECLWISGQGVQSAGTFRPDSDGNVHVELTTAATKYPGWRLEIRAHGPDSGRDPGVAVLDASA